MDRRKAIAIAAAVAMSLTSGVSRWAPTSAPSASRGASGAGTAAQVSVASGAPGTQPKSENRVQQRNDEDTAHASESRANGAAETKGQDNG